MIRYIKVDLKRIDEELQREVFALGASYRPPQTIQCDSKKTYDSVINLINEKNLKHEDTEYVSESLSILGRRLMRDYLELCNSSSRRERRESI